MKVLIVGVKYSPNLGDGIIADCVDAVFQHTAKSEATSVKLTVQHLDLAGRSDFVHEQVSRQFLINLSNWPLGKIILKTLVCAKAFSNGLRMWRNLPNDFDLIVVGGGQLLSDVDLNFPAKLYSALRQVRSRNTKLVVLGCGVASNWSWAGRKYFEYAFNGFMSVHVWVRDDISAANWVSQRSSSMPELTGVMPDFSVHAAAAYRRNNLQVHNDKKHVFIGVSCPANIAYSSSGVSSNTQSQYENSIVSLVRKLLAEDLAVVLGTNGAFEDEVQKQSVVDQLSGTERLEVVVLERPHTPDELVQHLTGVDVIVSDRLHALIVAYAFEKRFVGFGKDTKLKGFCHSIGAGDCYFECAVPDADGVVASINKLLNHKPDLVPIKSKQAELRRVISGVLTV